MERIKTLEELNERLAEPYFEFSWQRAETAYEKVAWHLLIDLPFDLDIILKGTREWTDDIDREAGDYAENVEGQTTPRQGYRHYAQLRER